MLIPVISLFILHSMIYFHLKNRIIVIIVSAGILLINLLIFYLYDALIETYERLQESMFFERQVASYSHQLGVMMKGEEKMSLLRHDMRHHLNELCAMARQNRGTEIEEYISHMKLFIENDREYCRSGNKEVDSLFNYLLNGAQDVLNEVSYQINIPKELGIKPFDLNAILGNLLENAIHAAQSSEEKWLNVEAGYHKGMLFICVQNSYQGKLEKDGSGFLSTKADKENHGIGLRSVKRVVDTYQGTMEIEHSENIFKVKIMLYV